MQETMPSGAFRALRPIILASSSPRRRELLGSLGIDFTIKVVDGSDPAPTLVLEDSYNGDRAGAAGGFVTVMVPDLLPADDEMRGLYTMECTSLNEVLAKLKTGEL